QVMHDAGVTSGVALACLMRQKGSICYLEGNYEEARSRVHEALAMLEQAIQSQQTTGDQRYIPDGELQTRTERAITGHSDEFGQLHELLGIIAGSTGQVNEALEHLQTAMAIYEKHDQITAMTKACGNLGAVYITKSDYSEAQSYLRRSLDLAERMSDLPNMGFIMGNLGDMAARMGNLPAAEEWFKRSLALLERVNDRAGIAWCFAVLAETLLNQGKLQEALEYIQRALLLGRAMRSSRNIAPALIALGNVRIVQTIMVCQLPAITVLAQTAGSQAEASGLHSPPCKRLLLRARNTLQRALALEGLEVEFVLEGKLMQARPISCWMTPRQREKRRCLSSTKHNNTSFTSPAAVLNGSLARFLPPRHNLHRPTSTLSSRYRYVANMNFAWTMLARYIVTRLLCCNAH
ncbi:MAG: tetratricopeptide repeat protein, partial [Ktedonobacteraceae bacterium]|nr:tetratricopeptide repeat protein [Ktedonobacteraceae bacterium]